YSREQSIHVNSEWIWPNGLGGELMYAGLIHDKIGPYISDALRIPEYREAALRAGKYAALVNAVFVLGAGSVERTDEEHAIMEEKFIKAYADEIMTRRHMGHLTDNGYVYKAIDEAIAIAREFGFKRGLEEFKEMEPKF
ncbi:MAG: hypothetical protein ACP5NX_00030, partial [Candidatus Bilamarchaeaceae archaeon]